MEIDAAVARLTRKVENDDVGEKEVSGDKEDVPEETNEAVKVKPNIVINNTTQ